MYSNVASTHFDGCRIILSYTEHVMPVFRGQSEHKRQQMDDSSASGMCIRQCGEKSKVLLLCIINIKQ